MAIRKPRFSLQQLLITVGKVAVVSAASVLAGGMGASLALVILMFVSIAILWTCDHSFATTDGLIWLGGVLAWISAFVAFSYGPMGGEISLYSLMHNIAPSWSGLEWIIILAPIFFGAMTAMLAFFEIRFGDSAVTMTLRGIGIYLFILLTAVAQLVLAARSILVFAQSIWTDMHSVAISTAVLIAASVVLFLFRCSSKSIAALHLIASLFMLFGLFPTERPDGLISAFASYGAGYWILCAGYALIAGAATIILVRRAL